jgi:hypothetical protein
MMHHAPTQTLPNQFVKQHKTRCWIEIKFAEGAFVSRVCAFLTLIMSLIFRQGVLTPGDAFQRQCPMGVRGV